MIRLLRFQFFIAVQIAALGFSATPSHAQQKSAPSNQDTLAAKPGDLVDLDASQMDHPLGEMAKTERKPGVIQKVMRLLTPVTFTEAPELKSLPDESLKKEYSLVQVETLPENMLATEVEDPVSIVPSFNPFVPSKKLIDPSLCERGVELPCENPSILDLTPPPCGHCQACQSGGSAGGVCNRIKGFLKRSHFIYRQTLLGDPDLFCERKFGSYLNAVVAGQVMAGREEQLVLFEYDFEQANDGSKTAILKPSSAARLPELVQIMLQTGNALIIEQTDNAELDNRRCSAILANLTERGFRPSPNSVITGIPTAPGQSGVEAEIQFRSRVTQQVRGSQAPANSPGGAASGFGSQN